MMAAFGGNFNDLRFPADAVHGDRPASAASHGALHREPIRIRQQHSASRFVRNRMLRCRACSRLQRSGRSSKSRWDEASITSTHYAREVSSTLSAPCGFRGTAPVSHQKRPERNATKAIGHEQKARKINEADRYSAAHNGLVAGSSPAGPTNKSGA